MKKAIMFLAVCSLLLTACGQIDEAESKPETTAAAASEITVDSTDASAKDNYYDVKYDDMNFAIIMGAEHAGVSKSLLKASDFVVKIPMQNSFNSLNVSNALSAIIFETLRQKLTKKLK